MLGSQKNVLGVGFLRLTVLAGLFYCGVDQRSQAQLFKMADISPILR